MRHLLYNLIQDYHFYGDRTYNAKNIIFAVGL